MVAVVALGLACLARHDGGRPAVATPTPVSMVRLLRQLAANTPPSRFPYANEQRAAMLARRLSASPDPHQRMTLERRYILELSRSGHCDEAVKQCQRLRGELKAALGHVPWADQAWHLENEVAADLRLGELQNCCANNNADSCLIPIRGRGVHTIKDGSQRAIRCLLRLLAHNPKDLTSRWLLNLAYMTIGQYPAKVPAQWLIEPARYGSEYPLPRFYNAAPELGLAVQNNSGGAAMEDFRGSGNLDVMVSNAALDGQLRYFRNNGDGTFTERTQEAGLLGETGGLNLITTDYNNDGRPDVLILRGGWFGRAGHLPVSLLRNNGDGTFTDVTMQCGLIKHMAPTQTAVWFDYNGDGWLDLFIGNESRPGDPSPCELWRNNGDGTFTDVTAACHLDIRRYVKGVVTADYDRDGRPDLYLSCLDGPGMLLHNDGPATSDPSPRAPWRFTDRAQAAGVNLQRHTFSCFFFDYDNDGWPDLYVGGYTRIDVGQIAADYLGLPAQGERPRLYHNNHDGTFTDVTAAAHLNHIIPGMGINFGDLDNDGWLDFYVGTGNPDLTALLPKRMFRNAEGRYFQEVTASGDFGHLQKGHGIAFGDLNNNGQEDVFIELGGIYSGDKANNALFVNPGNRHHWVTLELEGVKSNRCALGAETCVTVTTPGGERHIYQTVGSGGSFGCNPFRQHFGLGDATAIRRITIHWPASGLTQTITHVGMDGFWKIREGDTKAVARPHKVFPLPGQRRTSERLRSWVRS
jgi:hypothetical protein